VSLQQLITTVHTNYITHRHLNIFYLSIIKISDKIPELSRPIKMLSYTENIKIVS